MVSATGAGQGGQLMRSGACPPSGRRWTVWAFWHAGKFLCIFQRCEAPSRRARQNSARDKAVPVQRRYRSQWSADASPHVIDPSATTASFTLAIRATKQPWRSNVVYITLIFFPRTHARRRWYNARTRTAG